MKGLFWTIIVAASMWGRADGVSDPPVFPGRLSLIDDTYLLDTSKPAKPFYMDLFETSRRQSGQVMGSRPESVSDTFDVVFPVSLFSIEALRGREPGLSTLLQPAAFDPSGYWDWDAFGDRTSSVGLASPISDSRDYDGPIASCSMIGYGEDLTAGVDGASMKILGQYWLRSDAASDTLAFGSQSLFAPKNAKDWQVTAYKDQGADEGISPGLAQILRGSILSLDPHSFIQLEYTPAAADAYYHGVRLVLRSEL